jgi:hypothetical protein
MGERHTAQVASELLLLVFLLRSTAQF